jgi:hypothetical protein
MAATKQSSSTYQTIAPESTWLLINSPKSVTSEKAMDDDIHSAIGLLVKE